MGVIYTRGTLRQKLREAPSPSVRQELLDQFYHPHHRKLEEIVDQALEEHDRCLIIDGHSFPSKALPYEINSEAARPDFCLGIDDFHTVEKLVGWSILSCSASAIQQRVMRHLAEQSSLSSTIDKINESNH